MKYNQEKHKALLRASKGHYWVFFPITFVVVGIPLAIIGFCVQLIFRKNYITYGKFLFDERPYRILDNAISVTSCILSNTIIFGVGSFLIVKYGAKANITDAQLALKTILPALLISAAIIIAAGHIFWGVRTNNYNTSDKTQEQIMVPFEKLDIPTDNDRHCCDMTCYYNAFQRDIFILYPYRVSMLNYR